MKSVSRRQTLAALALIVAAVMAAGRRPSQGPPLYFDPDRPAVDRARDLVSRMTLDQKVRQMQNSAPAIPELQIPAYNWWNEALHGVARAGRATVFPQAIGLAATWDTDLMFRVADVISTEARAKYHDAIRQDIHAQYLGLTFWSPNINIFRDPRWGRGQETYGEDPFLTGRMAVSFIKGLQGDDPKYFKVIATAKHFAVHSGPESTRHSVDVTPSAEDLERTYLPAFKAAIVEGRADSVMCAYNRVNGLPACASPELLQQHLKQDWGFDGYVVSDCGAIGDIYRATAHHFLPTAGEASAAAVKAGTDLTCGSEYVSLVGAVQAGQIKETEIDAALVRLFTARFKLGMFDPPERVKYASIPMAEVDSPAHRALALEGARKSIVLLKNDRQMLPLGTSIHSLAVVGPSADDPVALLGNYNGYSLRQVTPYQALMPCGPRFIGPQTISYALGSTYVAGRPVPVPASAIFGSHEMYFANAELQGTPVFEQTTRSCSVPPPHLSPAAAAELVSAGVPARGFSARWTSTLTAPVSGEYVFSVSARQNEFRVFLDDRAMTAPVTLERARQYALRVEYRPAAARGGFAAPGAVELLWLPPADALLAQAREVVRASDATVAFVGLNPSLEGEEMSVNVPGFKGGDRTNLDLPAPQQALLDMAFDTGKPVIVVLTSGSAVAITSAATRARAVLAAWYGGEEIGTAIAETLTGANNPAGRLPVTFYRSVDQLPPFEDYSMRGRTYRYFTGDPLYRFGFGLSYSTFRYSNLTVRTTNAGVTVSAVVQNSSTREGDEVPQLYLSSEAGGTEPIRELKGFTRIHLRAGERQTVTFTVPAADMPKGRYTVTVGGGQPGPGVPSVTQTVGR